MCAAPNTTQGPIVLSLSEGTMAKGTTLMPVTIAQPFEGNQREGNQSGMLSANGIKSLSHWFNRRTGALVGAAIGTVAGTSLIQLANQPAQYEGQFQLLVEAAPVEPTAAVPTTSTTHQTATQQTITQQTARPTASLDYATQIQVLWSPKLLAPVAQKLQTQYADLTYDTLSKKLEITHADGEKTLAITYQDTDPKKVQAVLETVSQAYLQYSQECRVSLCRELKFVEKRLPQLQQQVRVAQQNLQTFQQQHTLTEPIALGQQLAQRRGVLQQQRQEVQIRLIEARTRLAILQQRMTQADARSAAVQLHRNDRYQSLRLQFQAIAAQLAVELARPQPDSSQLQRLKERYQQVSDQMTQVAQQPIAAQVMQAIADFQAQKTTDYTAVIRQQTRLEAVTAATQVQVLEISQQAIGQSDGAIAQQIKQWAALARQSDALNLELKFATDNLNLYQTKRAALRQFGNPQTGWQLTAAPAVVEVDHGLTFSDPESRLSLGLLLSFLLVTLVMSIAEQTKPKRQVRRRQPALQPEASWQLEGWQAESQRSQTHSDSGQRESWQAVFKQPVIPVTLVPPALAHQRTTLFLLTAATRIETVEKAKRVAGVPLGNC